MYALPSASPFTSPFSLTVAILLSVELKVTAVFSGVTVVFRVVTSPTLIFREAGETVSLTSGVLGPHADTIKVKMASAIMANLFLFICFFVLGS